eukprot:COSAG02_NODE_5018_length_4721_cov_6.541108_7_plen_229_part_00
MYYSRVGIEGSSVHAGLQLSRVPVHVMAERNTVRYMSLNEVHRSSRIGKLSAGQFCPSLSSSGSVSNSQTAISAHAFTSTKHPVRSKSLCRIIRSSSCCTSDRRNTHTEKGLGPFCVVWGCLPRGFRGQPCGAEEGQIERAGHARGGGEPRMADDGRECCLSELGRTDPGVRRRCRLLQCPSSRDACRAHKSQRPVCPLMPCRGADQEPGQGTVAAHRALSCRGGPAQ